MRFLPVSCFLLLASSFWQKWYAMINAFLPAASNANPQGSEDPGLPAASSQPPVARSQ